jgi:hypothetical protein
MAQRLIYKKKYTPPPLKNHHQGAFPHKKILSKVGKQGKLRPRTMRT